MKARARIPVMDAERVARDPEFREWLIKRAEDAISDLAQKEGRKISSRPEFVDVHESRLTPAVVYFDFEADTQPI